MLLLWKDLAYGCCIMKILLLEDDPNLARTLQKYLQKNGYEIDWARHGEEAIELSYRGGYVLYLFDVNVPLVSGIELLESLRSAEDATPAIFISAQVDIDSMRRGFDAGGDDYIKKPFDPQELLLRIEHKIQTSLASVDVHGYRLDPKTGVIYHYDTACSMGEVQKCIFAKLLRYYPGPVPKSELLECMETYSDGALRVNIAKLKKDTDLPIEAVRGVGYQIL